MCAKTVDFHCRRTLSSGLFEPCPGEGYAGVVASTRGLQALAAKAVLSLPAPKTGRFLAGLHISARTTGPQGSWDCTVVRPTESHLLFPQESSPSVPINDVVLRIKPIPATEICETPAGGKASMRPRRASARGGSLAARG